MSPHGPAAGDVPRTARRWQDLAMSDDAATNEPADDRAADPSPEPAPAVLQIVDGDGVRLITLDRPEALNAFNQALWYALAEALTEAAADDAIRCVVLTGAGRAFTAGQDLVEMADPSVFAGQEPGYQRLMPVLESFPKPLVAAVNGVGVGIGMTILPHCDLVFMAEGARIKAPFVSLGVTTEASASLLLPVTIGWQEAAHLLFTEPWIDAAEAVRLGLAWRVCAPEALLDEAMAEARTIGAMPVGPLVATKRLMLAARHDAVRDARKREEAEFARLIGSPDNQAALQAFLGA
jgi:enoyl-CoA hydratase/carnithine racemase